MIESEIISLLLYSVTKNTSDALDYEKSKYKPGTYVTYSEN